MPNYRLAKRPGFPHWYIVWSEHGRSKRSTTGEADRRKAELVLAAFRIEIERPAQARPDEVSVASVLTEYLDNHAANLPSKVQANIAGKLLLAHYGKAAVSGVTLEMQDRYIAKRRKAGKRDETIRREQSVLSAALRRAVKYDRLKSAPHVTLPKQAPARERYLARAEVAKLLRACPYFHLRTFIRLALYTGARSGAILDLTWDRVDFERRVIDYALPGKRQTNKRRVMVPFGGALYTALRRAKKFDRSRYVVSYLGHRVKSVKKGFGAAVARAGLEGVSPHTLRHTAATWAAQAGEDIWRISGILGQRLARTTELYAKHRPEYLRSTSLAIMRGKRQNSAK